MTFVDDGRVDVTGGNPLRRNWDTGRLVQLRNERCPYCFRLLTTLYDKDLDHVIGRRFVPRGKLAASWNLVVRACKLCNAAKARLEGVVSAVTMSQLACDPNLGVILQGDSGWFVAEARRKSRVRSSRTGRFVGESQTANVVRSSNGLLSLRTTLVGPPQLDGDQVLGLACMHVRGLASSVFMRGLGDGPAYLPPNIVLCAEAGRRDWGSRRLRGFMSMVRCWPSRLQVVGAANGYFAAMIRKQPGPRPVWAWALEWNRQHRLGGFMGDDQAVLEELAQVLPHEEWSEEVVCHDPDRGQFIQRWRQEVPLAPGDDDLFDGCWIDGPSEGAGLSTDETG